MEQPPGHTQSTRASGTPPRRQRILLAVGLALSVLLAGCVGATDSTRSSPTPTATETAAETPEVPTTTPSPAPNGATPTPGVSTPNRSALETRVHLKINERRRAHGLEPLADNATLTAIARSHGEDMLANGYFDHTAPDGETRADRYRRGGYECRVSINETHALTGAENLYRTTYHGQELSVETLASRTVSGWMNSSSHREQILQPAWTTEGIGVAIGTRDGETVVYVVQNFC